MSQKSLGIIGFGNMARAILDAVVKTNCFTAENIMIYNPTPGKAEDFIALGCRYATTPQEAAQSDYILLGVKPFKMLEILGEIGAELSGRCVISIAAGITVSSMAAVCAEGTHIVRVMPNAMLSVGCGASVVAENPSVPNVIFDTVCDIFAAGGIVEVLPEEKINEITPVSGSSPAFFYRIIDVMVKNATANGISPDIAYRLAAKTMEGAAKTLLSTDKTTSELIRIITTPGGTTQAALENMDASGFDKSLSDAMDACTRRTYELAAK